MSTIFSKIINKEIRASIVYENEHVLAFKDINPQAPIHILIIPKKEFRDILSVDSDTNSKLLEAVKDIAKQLGLEKGGFRLLTNCGEGAGQTVMHLHWHLLAGRALNWPPG